MASFRAVKTLEDGVVTWAIWRYRKTKRGARIDCMGVWLDADRAQIAMALMQAQDTED